MIRIPVEVISNYDSLSELNDWPVFLYSIPIEGEYIATKSGTRGRICGVTHCEDKVCLEVEPCR